MHRHTKALMLFAFNFCVIGFFLFIVNADGCRDREAVARIVAMQGEVTINHARTQLNAPLCLGDIIHTGRDSQAEVKLLDSDTIFRLEQQAELMLLRSLVSPRAPLPPLDFQKNN